MEGGIETTGIETGVGDAEGTDALAAAEGGDEDDVGGFRFVSAVAHEAVGDVGGIDGGNFVL
jgi:hypothetical protein